MDFNECMICGEPIHAAIEICSLCRHPILALPTPEARLKWALDRRQQAADSDRMLEDATGKALRDDARQDEGQDDDTE